MNALRFLHGLILFLAIESARLNSKVWRVVESVAGLLRYDGVNLRHLEELAFEEGGSATLGLEEVRPDRLKPELKMVYPSQVIILSQSRVTYTDESIINLSHSIEESGQISPTAVALLTTPEACQRYLDGINSRKGTDYKVGEGLITPNEDGSYYIVIAGHQRTLGNVVKNLRQSGSIDPDVDREPMPALLYADIDFDDAFAIQMTENFCRVDPPQWEEAFSLAVDYRDRRDSGSVTSLNHGARKIGVTEDRLRGAIRFTELPPQIQAYVIGDHAIFENYPGKYVPLAYPASVEIAKLSGYMSPEELTQVALMAMSEEWSARRAVKEVDSLLRFKELPESISNFISESGIDIKIAPYFSRLIGKYSEEAIIDFMMDYVLLSWSEDELESKVKIMERNAEYQQFSLQLNDSETETALSRHSKSMNFARRLKKHVGDLEAMALAVLGGHVPGLAGVSINEGDFLSAVGSMVRVIELLVGEEKLDESVLARAMGSLALVAARRTGLTAAEVLLMTGGSIQLQPNERNVIPFQRTIVEQERLAM